uniref:FBA_2 domain-containing protein n=1 Tax=Caenorhabditis tropicalis TaxID=1561998 RepID=A0A1I7V0Y6_9PELO
MEFPLIRLPDVPKIQIIQLMSIGERIKLALSSRKMENYLAWVFKNHVLDVDCTIKLRGNTSFIGIDLKWMLCLNRLEEGCENPDFIKVEELKPWIDEKSAMIERTFNVFIRLQKVLPCQLTQLVVTLNVEPTPILKILSYPCVANLTGVHFYGGTVKRNELDAIMEWRKENTIQYIVVKDNEIPLDYRHPNAFRFTGVVYGDARWISLEDLLSMRNFYRPIFSVNNFSMKDLNTFIKYWINCEENMFKYLLIDYKNINLSELMKDITVLKGFRSEKPFYLIASNSTENQLVLTIRLIEHTESQILNELDFSVQYANKPHKFRRGGTLPAWTREYRILGRLARKRWLEEEMITVGISIEEIKELDDLEEELTVEEVRMIDGIMTVQEKLGTPLSRGGDATITRSRGNMIRPKRTKNMTKEKLADIKMQLERVKNGN